MAEDKLKIEVQSEIGKLNAHHHTNGQQQTEQSKHIESLSA